MNTNTSSRSGLFLMELIISILFFSLASAVCVKLFVSSHTISKDSVELNHSLEWCQNVAEAFYGSNGDSEEMAGLFSNCLLNASSSTANELYLLFDKDFNPIKVSNTSSTSSLSDSCYVVSAKITKDERMLLCRVTAMKKIGSTDSLTEDIETIYELSVTLYPKKEVSHEK